jgi:D-proline reductase (dithiol) PrdB
VPTLAELPLTVRAFLRLYRWRRIDPVPCATLAKPLAACRVALVTTAGLVPRGEPPFDDGTRGGDWSYRVLPATTDLATLDEFQRSETFDHSGIARDRNLAFPLDRLHDLASDGTIGAVAPRHLSFMGSITAPGRLVRDSIPAATQLLVDDAVDVALLVPV